MKMLKHLQGSFLRLKRKRLLKVKAIEQHKQTEQFLSGLLVPPLSHKQQLQNEILGKELLDDLKKTLT